MLTPRMIVALTKPGRYADGGNLYLKIAKGGSKSWVFLYARDGKQTEIGLGSAQRRKRCARAPSRSIRRGAGRRRFTCSLATASTRSGRSAPWPSPSA